MLLLVSNTHIQNESFVYKTNTSIFTDACNKVYNYLKDKISSTVQYKIKNNKCFIYNIANKEKVGWIWNTTSVINELYYEISILSEVTNIINETQIQTEKDTQTVKDTQTIETEYINKFTEDELQKEYQEKYYNECIETEEYYIETHKEIPYNNVFKEDYNYGYENNCSHYYSAYDDYIELKSESTDDTDESNLSLYNTFEKEYYEYICNNTEIDDSECESDIISGRLYNQLEYGYNNYLEAKYNETIIQNDDTEYDTEYATEYATENATENATKYATENDTESEYSESSEYILYRYNEHIRPHTPIYKHISFTNELKQRLSMPNYGLHPC